MTKGLPILANTALFGAVMNIDRVLILWRVPDGERAAGLYATMALMGTGWSLDLAGRVVTVLSTHFLATLGRTGDESVLARHAMRAAEAQAPILAVGGAFAYVFAPGFLGMLMPRYVDGVAAIRPLLPGMVVLGMAWPARQMLLAANRPYRLFLASLAGAGLVAECAILGAGRAGMVGVAWGMTAGYLGVFLLTTMASFGPTLGRSALMGHFARMSSIAGAPAVAALIAAHAPLGMSDWREWAVRGVLLSGLSVPSAVLWARLFPEALEQARRRSGRFGAERSR
jgi:O-antigen/teichoic acid export membrane protein